MNELRPIFLLTDFGAGSYYQGIMKGVIASLAPAARVFDLGHGVKQGNFKEAAFLARTSLEYLPQNAILVIVVDPGVGSDRRILAASFADRILIVPDNGMLSDLMKRPDAGEVREVTNPAIPLGEVSSTFHGRDIFAPAAAHLAGGMKFEELGQVAASPLQLVTPEAKDQSLLLTAEVIHVDSFGNLITDVSRDRWIKEVGMPQFVIEVGGFEITRISPTFHSVRPGEPVAYIGSSGYLEIGIRDGIAAAAMKIDAGGKILVRKR